MKRILAILIALAFFLPTSVSASDRLNVYFESMPLFEGVSLVPGDVSTKTFTVKNTSGKEQQVGLKAINTEHGGLEEAIDVQVFAGVESFFSGTLQGFYNVKDFVDLGRLAHNTEKVFSMSVTFRATAGNEYQNKVTGFDLCVGFVGGGECVSDTGSTDENGGGDKNESSNNPQRNSRRGSTSQFVGDISGQNNETPPAVEPFDRGETAFSDEDLSMPIGSEGVPGEGGQNIDAAAIGRGESASEDLADAERGTLSEHGISSESEGRRNTQAAAAFLGLPDNLVDGMKCLAIFLFFLLAIWLLTLAFDAVRRAQELPRRERIEKRIVFVTSLFAASAVIAALVPFSCTVLPLYVSAWISVAWFFVERRRLRD